MSADKLWIDYGKTKDPSIREKLILEYVPVVKFVAGRLSVHMGTHVDYEDLVGYGIFGLIDAIDKFDPEKGIKFETYASVRIRGAIMDNIRRLDWIPRTIRQDNKRLEQAYSELENELGREPTDTELSEKLGLSLEQTRELIKRSSLASCISLDDFLEQNHETSGSWSAQDGQEKTPEDEAILREEQQILAKVIEGLSEKERLVIGLYYFEELTMREISQIMEVSESRVSQIHTKAVLKLKRKLGKYTNVFFT